MLLNTPKQVNAQKSPVVIIMYAEATLGYKSAE